MQNTNNTHFMSLEINIILPFVEAITASHSRKTLKRWNILVCGLVRSGKRKLMNTPFSPCKISTTSVTDSII